MNIGTHITASIVDGAQMMVKYRWRGKHIFHATLTWPNGEGFSGDISTTIQGAIDNLETRAKLEADAS